MKTVIEMAREAGGTQMQAFDYGAKPDRFIMTHEVLEAFATLVRADERSSWPAEMEAMERQVNILTDALNDRQRWFDALKAQHKQAILAEREACARIAWNHEPDENGPIETAIRARSNT